MSWLQRVYTTGHKERGYIIIIVCSVSLRTLITERIDTMIYVGIDVASTKHDCFIMDNHGEVLHNVFTFNNDLKGFKKLHSTITIVMESSNDSFVRIGLESTGLYHLNLLNYLNTLGYKVQEINPLLTSMERRASSVRKTKTDKIDARAICMFLSRNQNEFQAYTPRLYTNEALKSLSRRRLSLSKKLGKHKVELYTLVARTFPEYLNVFCNIYIKTSLEILGKYSIPTVIANTRIDGLTNTLSSNSMGKHKRSTALKLKELASTTIGNRNEYYAFETKLVVDTIRHYQRQLELIDNELKTIIDEHFSHYLSMPGVGYTTAALVIGEIGNIHRFKSFDQLLAYAGLDPIVYQSGNYNANNTRPSKRGSSYLRYAIFHISRTIVQHDPTFIKYYQKKISEGKHYFVALGHVSKKVLRVTYTLLKHNLSFVPNS